MVDTSILIDHLRGDARARQLLQRTTTRRERLIASVLTRAEVLAGSHARELDATRTLLATLEWIPVDVTIADRAGELANRYLSSHPGIDTVDYVIAATSQVLGARLYTLNRKHFPMLDDLPHPYAEATA